MALTGYARTNFGYVHADLYSFAFTEISEMICRSRTVLLIVRTTSGAAIGGILRILLRGCVDVLSAIAGCGGNVGIFE